MFAPYCRRSCIWLLVLSSALICQRGISDDSVSQRLRRFPAVEPNKAVESFVVAPGFRIDLVAAEPLVMDPIAMDFDAAGRLWLVEMADYSEQKTEALGRVVRLEDTDNDGKFDKRIVFLDGLSWPTAVINWRDGIFVAAPPHIYYCRDTNGDGQADSRDVVITGLGRSNVQGMANSFRFGLDGRIHVAASSCGGTLRWTKKPNSTYSSLSVIQLGKSDFSFDPDTYEVVAEPGGAQHGMCYDDWGRKYVCSNSDHIQYVVAPPLSKDLSLTGSLPSVVSIAADGPAAEVFRISPVEPWRVVRTELRVAGKVPGPIEGGGRAAGYFTSATGVTIYRGNAWPKEFHGTAIIGDVGGNLIHRKRIEHDKLIPVARRIDNKSEFVASRDTWFRPVQFVNAPDGCLYVADMYREVIEHPDSLPPIIKKHLDLTSGRDRGRIYRIAPKDFKQSEPLRPLDKLKSSALVELLSHPNGWHRDSATRLLIERGRDEKEVLGLIEVAARRSPSPLGRLHSLAVFNALREHSGQKVMSDALTDADTRVCENVLGMIDNRKLDGDRQFISNATKLANDENPRLRFAAASALLGSNQDAAMVGLAALAARDGDNPYMRAVISSIGDSFVTRLLSNLALNDKFVASPQASILLETLGRRCGAQLNREKRGEIDDLVRRWELCSPVLASTLVRGMFVGAARSSEAMRELRRESSATERKLMQLSRSARAIVADRSLPTPQRLAAMMDLAIDGQSTLPALAPLLATDETREVQSAAIRAIGALNEPAAAKALIEALSKLKTEARREAIDAIASRRERLGELLAAVEKKDVAPLEINPLIVERLRRSPKEFDPARVDRAFGKVTAGSREEVVLAHRDALDKRGDISRGREIFRKSCATCHKLENVGHIVGPDLAAMRNRGPETILLAILDPNREVAPNYKVAALQTVDGRVATGIIVTQTPAVTTLRRADGVEEMFAAADIDALSPSDRSLMPEGFERELSRQQLADLIAYFMAIK